MPSCRASTSDCASATAETRRAADPAEDWAPATGVTSAEAMVMVVVQANAPSPTRAMRDRAARVPLNG